MKPAHIDTPGTCPICLSDLPIPRHVHRRYCSETCRVAALKTPKRKATLQRLSKAAWENMPEEKKVKERARQRQYSFDQRKIAITHYGGVCACCGETKFEFLIDHIDGNGNKHRKEHGIASGSQMARWLKRNNYPVGFRILCHNCNMSIGIYGYCPHSL